MKILITNFRYLGFTGTETFIYSLLKFLRLNKINATFYSPFLGGEIVERTRRLGIKCVDNLEEIKNEQFDLIHCQQDLVAILSRFYFPKTPIVMLKHGFLTPIDTHSGLVQFNYYGGISHELVKIWEKEKIAKNRLFLFPNSVDLEKFSCFSPLPKIPQKLLVFNPRIDQKAKLIIKNVATKNHLAVKFLGLGKRIFNVEDRIKKADIVLTLGRAAYEAMACRKAVIIFANDGKSYQHGDGMITSKNIKKIAQNNFSGRTLKIPFTEDNLEQELQKYDPQMGDFNQQFVKNNYDIAKNIQIILTIYQKASQEKALAYDKKQVDFIAQGFQEILAYEKLIYRYRPFGQLISRRLKDEIKDNLA